MATFMFAWKSTKWWVLSTVAVFLKWLREQLKPSSIIVKVINDVTQFVSFLMLVHSKPTLRTSIGPSTIPKKKPKKKR